MKIMKRLLLLLCVMLVGGVNAWAGMLDVKIANTSAGLPSAAGYGSFSGQVFTTSAGSGLAGVTVTAQSGVTIGEQYVNVTNYGNCFKIVTAAAATTYRITLTAPDGYKIIGYKMGCSANTTNAQHTLTSADGTVSIVANAPNKQGNAPKDFNVNVDATQSTYFTISTANQGNTLYLPTFSITVVQDGFVDPITNLSNTKCYTLTTERGSLGTNGTQMVSTYGTSHSTGNFAIISYEEHYYLYSVADSKFVGNPKTINSVANQPGLTNDLSEVSAITFDNTGLTAPFYFMAMGSNGVNVSNYATGIVVNSWTTRDPGNKYIIEEADDFDPTDALAALEDYFHPSYFVTYVVKDESGESTLFTSDPVGTTLGANITTLPTEFQQSLFYDYNTINATISEVNSTVTFTATPKATPLFQYTSDTSNPVYYILKIKSDYYPTYDADKTPNVTTPNAVEDYSKVQWAFVGEPYAGFQLINKGAGNSLVLGSATVAEDLATDPDGHGKNTKVSLATPDSQPCEKWYIVSSTYSTNGFFLYNSEGYALNWRNASNLAYWTGGADGGSTFTIENIYDKYDDVIAQLKTYDYAEGFGHYGFTGGYAGYTSQASTIINGLETQGCTDENMFIAEALLASTAFNSPTGMFVRIKSTHDTYLSGTESTESSDRLSYIEDADASTLFYFDGNYLYNVANGWAASGRAVGTAGSTGVAYWFEESTITSGKYAIRFNPDGGSNRFLFAWNASGKHYADQNSSDAANCVFTLEEVTELPVTISAAGYATLYSPVALTIPTGVTAYTGYIDNSGVKPKLKLEALSEKIPAATAVILEGEAGNYNFTTTTADSFEGTNNLDGSLGGVASTANNILTLQSHNDIIGLYNYTGTTLNGFKAYLLKSKVPAAAEVNGFAFEFDTETGLEAIDNGQLTMDNAAIYNLAGQRVQKATKGLYIVNGKKVVLK